MGVEKRITPSKQRTVSDNSRNEISLARLLKILILTVKYHYEDKNLNKKVPANILDKIIKECIKQKSELYKITKHSSLSKEVIFYKIKPIALKVEDGVSVEIAKDSFNELTLGR